MEFPHYTIRESKRARHVGLRICMEKGLVVTVPKGFPQARVKDVLTQKSRWISRMHRKLEDEYGYAPGMQQADQAELPKEISLRAIDAVYGVTYRRTTSQRITMKEHTEYELLLHGNIAERETCQRHLSDWLTEKAQEILPDMLWDVSQETGLKYRDVSIRNQRARWGSCSSDKIINLNRKLLFLPPELVRYILVHELCHTRHLDHSSSFWRLVQRIEPYYKIYDRQTRHGAWQRYVPLWSE